MSASSTSEPYTPERTTGGAAAEEELIAGWCGVVLLADGKKKERGGKRRRGAGEMGARALPLHSPRLLIASRTEKPMGRVWD